MKKLLIVLAVLFVFSNPMNAKLALKNPCADGMVLQQNTNAVIWGFATPGATVAVSPSWTGYRYHATADSEGEWRAFVPTPEGGFKKYQILVKGDGGTMTINNVLVGEVWYASGQSNMEMPLRGWDLCPVRDQQEHISSPADPDGVRMFIIPMDVSMTPEKNAEGRWWYSTPGERAEMSATAYFFAKKLRETLNVPIGIINGSYGGTMLECWAPKNVAQKWGMAVDEKSLAAIHIGDRQTTHYNKQIAPCVGYTIRGMIWYQGCSNVGRGEQYAERFSDMVGEWRKIWQIGDFPVYAVEIAPFEYGNNLSPFLREQQWKSVEITPNCAMVPTNDLVSKYEKHNIHPGDKQSVGNRLAYLALNRDYGFKYIKCYAPKVVGVSRGVSGEIVLQVENAHCGFNTLEDIAGLEIAGSSRVFHPVTACSFDNRKELLSVRCDDVAEPEYVRYCWGDWVIGNLISCDGFPMQPFNICVNDYE